MNISSKEIDTVINKIISTTKEEIEVPSDGILMKNITCYNETTSDVTLSIEIDGVVQKYTCANGNVAFDRTLCVKNK